MKAVALVCCWLLLLPLASFAGPKKERNRAPERSDWVRETLRGMTLDEKVGQMLVPALSPVFMNQQSDSFEEIERNITQFHVGGYHAFGGDPVALAFLLNRLQKMAKVPLLITADLEGGPGFQFRGATRIPRAMALGAAGEEQLAYEAGKLTAIEGRAMGIGVNFYPVADVNVNPRNPIINIRSFGEDVAQVARLAQAYIRGAQENGQIATAKHFPGHGDASQDTHLEPLVLDLSRERLNQVELPPFRAAIETGVGAIMTAHIALPQIEPETEKGLPATLSKAISTDLLRGELGFQGLLFSDAMTMQAVTAHFTPEDATLRAVKAGADIILIPVSVEKSFRAIKAAVESGDVPLARIEDSVRRILEAKARLGLDQNRLVALDQLDLLVGSAEHAQLARTMIERGLTLVRDEKHILPLKLGQQSVLLVNLLDSRQPYSREGTPGAAFYAELLRRHKNTTEVIVDDMTSKESLEILKKLAQASDAVIANGFIRVAAHKGSIDLTEGQLDFLRFLSKMQKPFVFSLFGSPYLLGFVPDLPTYILTYDDYPEAERAAVRAILGEVSFTGKLPISLPGAYPIGHGLRTEALPSTAAP